MRAAQIPSNKHDIDWCKWNRQLLKIMSFPPPLSYHLYTDGVRLPQQLLHSRHPGHPGGVQLPVPHPVEKSLQPQYLNLMCNFIVAPRAVCCELEQICLVITLSVGGLGVDATTTHYTSVISLICVSKQPTRRASGSTTQLLHGRNSLRWAAGGLHVWLSIPRSCNILWGHLIRCHQEGRK